MLLEAGIECTSCFPDVEFGALSTTNHMYDVTSLAVEMFRDIHGVIRSATERVRFTLTFIARSGSWCTGNWWSQL